MKKSNSEIQFENDKVCVFKVVIPHDHPLQLEGHSHIVVGLTPGTLRQGDDKEMHIKPHQAYWLSHGQIRSCQQPLEVMVIAMKGPKDRPLPSIPID